MYIYRLILCWILVALGWLFFVYAASAKVSSSACYDSTSVTCDQGAAYSACMTDVTAAWNDAVLYNSSQYSNSIPQCNGPLTKSSTVSYYNARFYISSTGGYYGAGDYLQYTSYYYLSASSCSSRSNLVGYHSSDDSGYSCESGCTFLYYVDSDGSFGMSPTGDVCTSDDYAQATESISEDETTDEDTSESDTDTDSDSDSSDSNSDGSSDSGGSTEGDGTTDSDSDSDSDSDDDSGIISWLQKIYNSIAGTDGEADYGSEYTEDDGWQDGDSDEMDLDNSGFGYSSSCPANPSFEFKGQTYSFDLTDMCSLFNTTGYVVLILAGLWAVKVISKSGD